MRFETPKDAYRIIRVLKKELSVCSYLAEDSRQGKKAAGGQRFLLLEFRNPVLAKEMIPYFMELKEVQQNAPKENRNEGKNPFPDFVDCFVREKEIWAVFCYHEGIPFREAAERAVSGQEKLLLWEGLLERLFLQKMPTYLRYEAANPENIVVDDTAVWVNYELYETDRLNDVLFIGVQKQLYESFRMLFQTERVLRGKKGSNRDSGCEGTCNAGRSPRESFEAKAAQYARRLAEGEFEDERMLYREFREMSAGFLLEEGSRKDRGLLRLWKFVFGHTGVIVKCMYFILVLSLWGLFVWLCARPKTAPEERGRISIIGTMEVAEPQQPAE